MMTVSRPMTADHAESYFSNDDYYLSTKGIWQGKGAERLGLAGEVSKEDFSALAGGRDPGGGDILVMPKPAGEHRAGIDLTFSAPKSVSILSLADHRILKSHEAAVTAALNYVEAHYAQARTTEKGVTHTVDTGNLVVAKFNHMTSREMDPQLHTHSFVMNITQRPDQAWRAVRNEQIYRQQRFLGQVYRSELASEIRKLGYEISVTDRSQGFFEVRGIPRALSQEFSKRREQVLAQVKALKQSGEYPNAREAQLYEIAALGSRREKEDISSKELMNRWTETISAKGLTLEAIRENALKEATKVQALDQQKDFIGGQDAVRKGADAVTEREAVFHKEKVLETGLKLTIGERTIQDLEGVYQQLLKENTLKHLGEDRRGVLFTTKEMQDVEKAIVAMVRERQGSLESIDKRSVEAFLHQTEREGTRLTEGQKEAIRMIATSSDAVTLIQGDAGAGKTTAMKGVKALMEQKGWQVRGLAFTGKAASELYQGSGIASETIARFLKGDLKSLGSREVWIVDEASMIGSKDLYALLERSEKVKAKVILLGDRKQFQSIQAGRMFSILQDQGQVRMTEMKEVLRQRTDTMREAVQSISKKEIDKAFATLEGRGKIEEIPNRESRLIAVAKEYLSLANSGKEVLVLTARNEDRTEINDAIRSERISEGDLTKGKPFQIFEQSRLDPAMAGFADAYQPDQMVVVTGKIEGLKAGAKLEIIRIDLDRNNIIGLAKEKGSSEIAIDVGKDHHRLALFQPVERLFSEGDKVLFLKNDRTLKVQNGLTGQIEKIHETGGIQVKTGDGRSVKFDLSGEGPRGYSYLTHAYALTEYKAQGQTVDDVIWHAPAGDRFKDENTMNAFYVSITRARDDVKVYTDSREDLKAQVKEEQEKTSTLDYPTRSDEERPTEEVSIKDEPNDRDEYSWDLIGDASTEASEKSEDHTHELELER